jgi:hypothetical protein
MKAIKNVEHSDLPAFDAVLVLPNISKQCSVFILRAERPKNLHLKMKAEHWFKTFTSTNPVTQCHIP